MNVKSKEHMKKVIQENFNMTISNGAIDSTETNVERAFKEAKIYFLSEWFFDENIHKVTKLEKNPLNIPIKIPTQYSFPDSNNKLREEVVKFHEKEGLEKDSFSILETEGSTPMITSIILFAKKLGFKKIYSITPLYFTIYKICDRLDLEMIECNKDLTHDNAKDLTLPNKKSFLFITDSIWSIGRHHHIKVFKKLRAWQDKTNSLIFIDGSFSYMDWYKEIKKEPSILLDSTKTFRLVCPTKTLCLNGLRYSYLICPKKFVQELNEITCSNIGASCFFSNNLRERMFEEMSKEEINPVGKFCSERFEKLKEKLKEKDIEYIPPNCGFFFYANIKPFIYNKGLNKKYYWLNNFAVDTFNKKYKGYAKISLLSKEETFKAFLKDLN